MEAFTADEELGALTLESFPPRHTPASASMDGVDKYCAGLSVPGFHDNERLLLEVESLRTPQDGGLRHIVVRRTDPAPMGPVRYSNDAATSWLNPQEDETWLIGDFAGDQVRRRRLGWSS
ncbi:hypothetical protein [Microtetraspora malaysiensis]|uniref:hypothetical protein n=1 Tax=Microtetraspora malaysiensis TaxID=161358 RepID=UPI003D920F7B